jgi:hypothetical protein
MSELLERHRREIVPAVEPLLASARGFAEEPVADKYAALDHRLPRFSRTFEDAAVPESWLPPRQAGAPAVPWPAAHAAAAGGHELREDGFEGPGPDQTIDRMIPWIDEAFQPDLGSIETGGAAAPAQSPKGLADPLSAAAGRPEREPIEAQFAMDVLDACLEVQTALGSWHEPSGSYVTTFDAAHGKAETIEVEHAAGLNAEYDVIEPDPAKEGSYDSVDVREEPAISAPTGRYVPKPKYRHVFSTLRRRLGRGAPRKA